MAGAAASAAASLGLFISKFFFKRPSFAVLKSDLSEVSAQTEQIKTAFKERMREVTKAGDQRVVLDLARVQFLDSSGLGAIVAVKKMLGPARPLELSGLTATVEKVFRLTRMDSIFTIHSSIEVAISHAPGS